MEIKKVENKKEIPTVSPEVEVIEIDTKSLNQYGKTAETFVEQQSPDVVAEAEQKIESSAQRMNISRELLDSTRAEHGIDNQLAQIKNEADQLTQETKLEISEAVAEAPVKNTPESKINFSWSETLKTPAGKEFSEAMRGVVDGKQDVTGNRITNGFAVREFVRKHPEEARQFNDIFQKESGQPHSELAQAYQEIEELKQKPPEIPVEDPKYAELSYRIDSDPEYKKFRKELDTQHTMQVFGTTDLKTISLDRFRELASTDANVMFSPDREAEKAFRGKFAEKSALYDEREKTRVYRDPDGMINRNRDPLFLKMFESNSRGAVLMPDEALKQFAVKYPEKARGYAEKYTDLQVYMGTSEQNPKQERQATQQEREEVPKTAFEIREVVSEKEAVAKISEQLKTAKENGVAFDDATLQERQKALAERPIIDSGTLREATAVLEDKPTFSWVETDKIVGRPFGDQNPGGWSFEYEARKGRIVEIAKELSGSEQDEQKVEHVFHPGKPNEHIKLSVLEGPSGPMYSVEDGTHRIAGAMAAKLREIPCDIKRIKYPLERITTSENDFNDWQKKIELGLIQGKIETLQNNEGKKFYKLIARKEVLPWIRTVSQNELIEISRTYEKLYPGSLDKLDIPRDALMDPIANNYFMAGRWREWVEKFSKKPRDKNRMVIYS